MIGLSMNNLRGRNLFLASNFSRPDRQNCVLMFQWKYESFVSISCSMKKDSEHWSVPVCAPLMIQRMA